MAAACVGIAIAAVSRVGGGGGGGQWHRVGSVQRLNVKLGPTLKFPAMRCLVKYG